MRRRDVEEHITVSEAANRAREVACLLGEKFGMGRERQHLENLTDLYCSDPMRYRHLLLDRLYVVATNEMLRNCTRHSLWMQIAYRPMIDLYDVLNRCFYQNSQNPEMFLSSIPGLKDQAHNRGLT